MRSKKAHYSTPRRIINKQRIPPQKQKIEQKPSPKAHEEPMPWVLDVGIYRSPAVSKSHALRSVHGTLTFKLADGRELRNLVDLAAALEEMADDVFFHHANLEKNDFSSWLKDVFELEGLADAIRTASKPEMREKLYKHLMEEVMR